MRTDNTKNAFTLVELLVVISIIALLLGILLPTLGAARGVAQRTICAFNIRNCSAAFSLYAHDYNGFLPLGNIWGREDKPEGWLDINYDTAVTIHTKYGIEEISAMCTSWYFEKDKYFQEPPSANDGNFKLGGMRIGYIYYGRRFDQAGDTYSPMLPDGSVYKSPRKLENCTKNSVTSQTLFTCSHWDSTSAGGAWGAKFPHTGSGRGVYYQAGVKEFNPRPKGLVTGYTDCSAEWVKWKNLKWFQQAGSIRIYYSPRM
ncbi:MAG TPA: hypothetical protein DDW84_02805 [Phycisphaerales bacterium]|nr:MAG: hypothetical protein A2Y13_00160 [Planctomycetes bacterium GWC2_45_44]HBG77768.1 hypothetical protein [Phycisphaerales bacterium]HBR20222.1 hypothetical protein [Phycisphaerales bacterium]